MKRWALLVVLLYGTILAVLAGPLILAAFVPDTFGLEVMKMQAMQDPRVWPVWAWVAVMMLAEALLLVVPVRAASGRPVRKRHVLSTVLATIFAVLLMVGGMVAAAIEHLGNTPGAEGPLPIVIFSAVGVLWLLWSILFGFYGGRGKPKTLISRLVRVLLAGSILELLIAVPTHIIARWRSYCCAGFMTFWGLATGVSVLLFAFGPGTFVLFIRRLRSVRPPVPHAYCAVYRPRPAVAGGSSHTADNRCPAPSDQPRLAGHPHGREVPGPG
ncbi:MAG: hypothetical protein WBF17_27475, partial [Phycisphaerae bacterium]